MKWIQNDGEQMLRKYTDVPLDSEALIKECESEFEKFYFISMVRASPFPSFINMKNEKN